MDRRTSFPSTIDWELPEQPHGVVIFAHGSGSSRLSPRNQQVAAGLRSAGFGTLLFDLLTAEEDSDPGARFDIPLLARRLISATEWVRDRRDTRRLKLGYFGASTGAAAALMAAAALTPQITAVVSRGGRPDLAAHALSQVRAATLLIVGGRDERALELNRQAARQIRGPCELAVVPGAAHLFVEPGALVRVQQLAADWFARYLALPTMVAAR